MGSGGWSLGRFVVALASALTVLVAAADGKAVSRVNRDVYASQVYRQALSLAAGVTYQFRTRADSSATDPVMHLLTSGNVDVARDDDAGGGIAGRDSKVCYSVPAGAGGTYFLVVHAYDHSWRGTGKVQQVVAGCATTPSDPSWTNLTTSAMFGGSTVPVDSALYGATHHQTVMRNLDDGAVYDTVLYGLFGLGVQRITSYDDDSGVGRMDQLSPTSGNADEVNYVVVGAYVGEGPVDLLSNDLGLGDDADADGVGQMLEFALGSCDRSSTPLSHCPGKLNNWLLVDTDRDGLDDYAEIFGIDNANASLAQQLPAWGARPNKKDLFVEQDMKSLPWCKVGACTTDADCNPSGYAASTCVGSPKKCAPVDGRLCWPDTFTGNPLPESMVLFIQQRFSKGYAYSLQNPDGTDGVNVHFDIGKVCPNGHTLCGNWGGGGQWATGRTLDPSRQYTFRHLLVYPEGGGSHTPSNGYEAGLAAWSASDWPIPNGVVHELGHSVGLHHWGHDSWGKLNCKPNYVSLMNYAHDWAPASARASNPPFEFSRGTYNRYPVLNPQSVGEVGGFFGTDSTMLGDSRSQYSFLLTSATGDVDWNRNGSLDTGVIRSALNFNEQCGMPSRQQDKVAAVGTFKEVSPDAIVFQSALIAFYVNAAGTSVQAAATELLPGPTAFGSCNTGTGQPLTPCHPWSEASTVVTMPLQITGLSAYAYQGHVFLALRTSDGVVHVGKTSTLDGLRRPVFSAGVSAVESAGTFGNDVELSAVYVDPSSPTYGGASEVLGLFYLVPSGSYGRHTRRWLGPPAGTWSSASALVVEAGGFTLALDGSMTAGVATWPARNGDLAVRPDIGVPCAALSARAGSPATDRIGFYCYNKANDRWVQRIAPLALTDKVVSKPGLAFQAVYAGASSGSVATTCGSGLCGSFYLVPKGPGLDGFNGAPALFVSNRIDSSFTPTSPVSFVLKANVHDYTSGLTAPSLVSDQQLSALKGLLFNMLVDVQDSPRELYSFGFLDGTFNGFMADGDDFRVMERNICMGLHASETRCGSPLTNPWGY